jgi:hypothetical protein
LQPSEQEIFYVSRGDFSLPVKLRDKSVYVELPSDLKEISLTTKR